LIDRVGKWWEAAKDYWDILRPMRFCVFVWVAITLLITAIPQSQDALLALFENVFPGGIPDNYDSLFDWLRDPQRVPPLRDSLYGMGHLIAFAAGALFWAWQTFYWARLASRLPRRPRGRQIYSSLNSPPILSDARIEELNERTPHWLGGLVLVSVWAALVLANLENSLYRGLRDALFAGCSAILVALFLAYHRGHIRLVFLAMWAALLFGAVNQGFDDSLNPLYEVTLSAMLVTLFFAYRKIVKGRRKFANTVGRKLGFRAVPNFSRDLDKIMPSQRVKFLALGLAMATLAIFFASGFLGPPKGSGLASAVAITWTILGWWAAGELQGVPPGTKAALRINIGLFAVLFLVSIDPNTPIIGKLSYLHSPAIIMSVAALWVFVGTFFLAVPGEILGLPITSIVIVLAILASFSGRYDNHGVRTISEAKPWNALSLDYALKKWWDSVPKPTDQNDPIPLVLVATAGGASRAAYWTTEVLAQIEQYHPGFHKYIFAISSVSGGSLGAVVYRTMLNDVINDQTPNETSDGPNVYYCEHDGKATKKNMLNCGLSTIDHDFLGPTFLTGLYADLAQRFLPGSLLPDRATALERSWEEAWRRTMGKSSKGLDVAFHSLWNDKTWLPALIINGTSEKTGRRIITSNLSIDPNFFTDAIDYFDMVRPQHDIAVSTAAHNSARFPYIDAAGTLMTPKTGTTDRIVDGGYFENFGAGSIYDLLRALDKKRSAFEEDKGRKIKFFVIQISSDPALETGQPKRDRSWREKSPFTLNIASDLTAPPVALLNTGSATGYRATQLLKELVGNEYYAEFRLTDNDAAMSWVLSRKSIDALNHESKTDMNIDAYNRLREFMKVCWGSPGGCVP
jgi:hypothetical protein